MDDPIILSTLKSELSKVTPLASLITSSKGLLSTGQRSVRLGAPSVNVAAAALAHGQVEALYTLDQIQLAFKIMWRDHVRQGAAADIKQQAQDYFDQGDLQKASVLFNAASNHKGGA